MFAILNANVLESGNEVSPQQIRGGPPMAVTEFGIYF